MRSGKKFFNHHCQECLVFTLQKFVIGRNVLILCSLRLCVDGMSNNGASNV